MPVPASGGLSVPSGSVVAGTDLLSLGESSGIPGLLHSMFTKIKGAFLSLCFTFFLFYNLCLLPLVLLVGTLEKSLAPSSSFSPSTFRNKHIFEFLDFVSREVHNDNTYTLSHSDREKAFPGKELAVRC